MINRYCRDKPPLTDQDQVVVATNGALLLSCGCALPLLLRIKCCRDGSNPGTQVSIPNRGSSYRLWKVIWVRTRSARICWFSTMLSTWTICRILHVWFVPCNPPHTGAWVANQYQSPTQSFKMLWHTVLEGISGEPISWSIYISKIHPHAPWPKLYNKTVPVQAECLLSFMSPPKIFQFVGFQSLEWVQKLFFGTFHCFRTRASMLALNLPRLSLDHQIPVCSSISAYVCMYM